jgi:hypothetical protein
MHELQASLRCVLDKHSPVYYSSSRWRTARSTGQPSASARPEAVLAVLGSRNSHLRVYVGCNPTCTAVADNVLTNGEAVFGHLNNDSKRFVAGNFRYGQIDI